MPWLRINIHHRSHLWTDKYKCVPAFCERYLLWRKVKRRRRFEIQYKKGKCNGKRKPGVNV
uniref:Uncharacterized protein n=1 Tax=Pristionchus pacificus TaxID=54126 RepID=A0A2A6BX49_PRIPA|eukprot:PDM70484.1 hypothetical protein PRIPAC_46730 [Pristionchus pacificus]